MKKRLLPALLALVMVLGMLPMTVFAAPAETPAKVINYGFVWDASSLEKGSTIEGTGAKVGNDWMNETMYVVTDKPIGTGNYLWIKVTIGGEVWGCYAGNSATATTYAFSFLNRAGQWEKMPEGVTNGEHAEKYLESKITEGSESLTMALEVYSGVTYTPSTAPTNLPEKASFKRNSIALSKDTDIKLYNGYPVSEWISDMNTALTTLGITDGTTVTELTLTDPMTQIPTGAFLNVYANMGVFEAAEQLGSEAQKTQATAIQSKLDAITKINASGLNTNNLIGFGTLSPYTKLEELNFSGNKVSATDVLPTSEISMWASTLTKLDLSNTGVIEINALAGNPVGTSAFTQLTELNLSNNSGLTEGENESHQTINGITALAYCTNLTTLDISNTGIKDLGALVSLTKLTSLKATGLTNVNLLGLVALVNKDGFTVSSLADGAFVFTGSTLDDSLTDAQKLAVNKMIDDLDNKATGLTKYTVGGTPVEEKYSITITAPVNGTVTTSPADEAAEGTEVTITATPANSAYMVDTIAVADVDGNEVTVTDSKFTMPGKAVTVAVTFKLKDNAELTYTAYADMTDSDKQTYYGGKLHISGLTSGQKYVVTFDNGLVTGGVIPRLATVVTADAEGEVTLSCQASVKVMVFAVIGDNVTTDLTPIFNQVVNNVPGGVPVTELGH